MWPRIADYTIPSPPPPPVAPPRVPKMVGVSCGTYEVLLKEVNGELQLTVEKGGREVSLNVKL